MTEFDTRAVHAGQEPDGPTGAVIPPLYLTSTFYAPESCRGARFDDPAFGIQWPLPVSAISEQDRNWPLMQGQRNTPGQNNPMKERFL